MQCLYVRAGGCAVLVRRAVLVCACSACMCVQGDVQCLFVRAVLACACSACMCMQCLYVRAVLVRACRGMCSACTCVQGDVQCLYVRAGVCVYKGGAPTSCCPSHGVAIKNQKACVVNGVEGYDVWSGIKGITQYTHNTHTHIHTQ